MSAGAPSGRFAHIDAMRAVAVMLVVVAHAGLDHVVPGGSGGTGIPAEGALEPAFRLWAQVVSRPEFDLALRTMGRRDVSFDAGLPTPRSLPLSAVEKLNDQHAFLTVPAALMPMRLPDSSFGQIELAWLDVRSMFRTEELPIHLGRVNDARRHWEAFSRTFKNPDPELRPMIEEARQALARAERVAG